MLKTTGTYEAALRWLSLGIAPIPIRYRDKRPLIAWNRYRHELPSFNQVRFWFRDKARNLGLLCGWQDLVVIDFDDRELYDAWRVWAGSIGGIAADIADMTYQVQTRRGVHVYVAIEGVEPLKLDGIDVKAAGGYVLAPPSTHPTGSDYAAIEPQAPILRAPSLDALLPAEMLVEPAAPVVTISPRRVSVLETDDPLQAAMMPAMLGDTGMVDAVKEKLDLLSLLPPLVRRGSRYWVRCPLHDDHEPSMSVDVHNGRVKCWGGCTDPDPYWDAVDLYAALNNMTVKEVIREVA